LQYFNNRDILGLAQETQMIFLVGGLAVACLIALIYLRGIVGDGYRKTR
jgi:hypothetical protein